ncbi:nucleoside 2-deoxyribosyltransferase [Staphylococcus phage vB-SscS-F1]|nr:nucleoside 2-deoxyribosyltransferase [Arcanobacterium phage vB-ApyS-JF1]
MEDIKVGDLYNLKETKKFYTVSNVEVYLSTDIYDKDEKIITLNDNETNNELMITSDVFWDMFKKVTKEEEVVDKVVYMAGHILNQAMVEYREKQHNEVKEIKGVKPYSPHQDKSINDKSNAEQDLLAERILNNDFKAMQESDVFVFDILNEGLGTQAELAIVLGMKHQAQETIKQLEEQADILMFDEFDELSVAYDILQGLIAEQKNILNKPVFCYCSDIRQGHGKPYNDPDRAEFSTNQFIYGMIMSLTNGEGFISWEEVKERLKNL